MSLPHILLATAVTLIWGTNFVVIKVGLGDFPPFLFATLRFVFSALPWILFIKRPNVSWQWLVLYGLCIGGQFGFLFLAIQSFISPGLASLVVQMQVFFTIGLSVFLFNERIRLAAMIGIGLAAMGLGIIAFNIDATVTVAGLALVLLAAFCWGCSNLVVKKASAESIERIDMLSFMVWSSVFAIPPLMGMSLLFEGSDLDLKSLQGAHIYSWFALAWQVLGNTLFGYAAWNWLLSRHQAATVTPYALMIPIFGIGASAQLLGEALPIWKIGAGLLVLSGLAVITLGGRLAKLRSAA